ncbi:MAG TPA: hypothetical protein VF808_04470 [Ktedonobacterales bacterium]
MAAPTPPRSSAQRPARALMGARYRVYQVWRSLAARPLDDEDRAILDTILPAGGRALFATMSRNDQRHSLTVYGALRERGCEDPDMLAAALLHDSGKGNGRTPFIVRPMVVLLRRFAPGALDWLASAPSPWFRRPFYFASRHAAIGADLAARAGMNARVVTLIRLHHAPDGPAAELHAVDDEV